MWASRRVKFISKSMEKDAFRAVRVFYLSKRIWSPGSNSVEELGGTMSIRTSRKRSLVILAATVGLVATAVLPAWSQPPLQPPVGDLTVFPTVPGSINLVGITSGPDGALWVTAFNSSKIMRMTTGGSVTEYALQPGRTPGQITSGPDGALWFTEITNDKIGRITTAGTISEFDVPTSGGEPFGITAGPDGALWFAERNSSKIGRITTAGVVTEYDTPTPNSVPEYIAAGPDGALWFTERNTSKIGRITTAGVISEYDTITAFSGPQGIAAGPDGALWFTEQSLSKIGRITTAGVISEYDTITPSITPQDIAAGPDGALWFTTGPSGIIGRITTAGVVTNEFLVQPSSDYLYGIAAGPDGAMWFTEADTSRVARVTTGLPGASSSITGTAGNASAVVSWYTPNDGGANGVSRYTVTAAPGGRTCSTVATSGFPTCTVTGLTNGRAYTFSVRATNGFGTGPASSASAAVTPRAVPGAPRSLGARCPSETRVKISWIAPVSNGGASITKYQVRFKDKVTGRYTAWANTTGRSFTKAGLIKNRSYMVQVRAFNVAGPGSAASKTFKQLK